MPNDVLMEIDAMNRRLKRIEEAEAHLLENQRIIINRTEVVLATEQDTEKKLTRMKYSDITAWRSAIWEHCQFKEAKTTDVTISYWCAKLQAPCKFEDCPLNHY